MIDNVNDNKKKEKQVDILKNIISNFRKTLLSRIDSCNQVFLIAHKELDFDAIASLGALALVCKKLKKAPYIIIDDEKSSLKEEHLVMIDKLKEKFIIITTNDYEKNKTDNDLLIMADVNKKHRTYLENKYRQFNNIIIVDHHKEDENTVATSDKLIIDEVSSCSEICYYLFKMFNIVPTDLSYYTYLLAGIYLDTKKGTQGAYPSTHEVIKELQEKGANEIEVEKLFSLDYESDRRVQRMLDKTHFTNIKIGIAVNSDEVYSQEEVAQAADYILKYGCDVAIASGKTTDGRYRVSARTKNGSIGINEIMYILNKGGGNLSSAACEPIYVDANKSDLENEKEIEDKIMKILTHKYNGL